MTVPVLPPVVDIDGDTKKAIINGLKQVLEAYKAAGLVDVNETYQNLISSPDSLYKFIQVFLANRETADEIVRPKVGDEPVRNDDVMLQCDVSLNQIQQLLVRTCAKKAFEQDVVMETVTETVTKKAFLFFTKKEEVEIERPSTDPLEERKAREISKYMAFAWQLPLINPMRKRLNSAQIMEIGDALIALTNLKTIDAIAGFDSAILKKAKAAAGEEFKDVIASQPRAVGGIAVWNREMYQFYRKLLGEHAWVFFAREKDFFNAVVALDKTTAKMMGYMLCYISLNNMLELQRLNLDKIEVMAASLTSAFGANMPALMGDDEFGVEFLRKMVDNLLHMNQEKDKLLLSFGITCKSMVSTVNEWQASRPQQPK